jgi:hypothetical protein
MKSHFSTFFVVLIAMTLQEFEKLCLVLGSSRESFERLVLAEKRGLKRLDELFQTHLLRYLMPF